MRPPLERSKGSLVRNRVRLMAVRRIVDLHDGTVSVQSTEDRGTKVMLATSLWGRGQHDFRVNSMMASKRCVRRAVRTRRGGGLHAGKCQTRIRSN